MGKHRESPAMTRFKRIISTVAQINKDIETGKLTYLAARRILDEETKDAAGRTIVKCDEVVDDGKRRFVIPKKYVEQMNAMY